MQEDFVESWWRVQEVMNSDPSKRESGRLNFIKIKPTGFFFFFFKHNDKEILGSAAWKSYTVSVI